MDSDVFYTSHTGHTVYGVNRICVESPAVPDLTKSHELGWKPVAIF